MPQVPKDEEHVRKYLRRLYEAASRDTKELVFNLSEFDQMTIHSLRPKSAKNLEGNVVPIELAAECIFRVHGFRNLNLSAIINNEGENH